MASVQNRWSTFAIYIVVSCPLVTTQLTATSPEFLVCFLGVSSGVYKMLSIVWSKDTPCRALGVALKRLQNQIHCL